MLKVISYCIALGLTLSAGATLLPEDKIIENAQSIIVQGANQSIMARNIEAAGGQVLHSFSVIEAVSAELTEQQISSLKLSYPSLRFFTDSDVIISAKGQGKGKGYGNTSTTDTTNSESASDIESVIELSQSILFQTQKPLQYDLWFNTVTWGADNRLETAFQVKQVDISWPVNNGPLKALEIFGRPINWWNYDPSTVNIGNASATFHFSDEQPLGTIAQELVLTMEFDNIDSVLDSDYDISIIMTDGTVLEFGKEYDVSAGVPINYEMGTQSLSWKAQNTSLEDRLITDVMVAWPVENGVLNTLTVNGIQVTTDAAGGSMTTALTTPIKLAAGETIKIAMEFADLTSVNDLDYGVQIAFDDGSVKELTSTNVLPIQGELRDTFYPTLVNADQAHARGITGLGVTVAIIDTGFEGFNNVTNNVLGEAKSIHVHNVLDTLASENVEDLNGHGTHIASIIGNSNPTVGLDGQLRRSYSGIAPSSNLVIVKAFDEQGRASYDDILRAIEYVVENKELLNIKVLNLSFSATPSSYYWDDPINQAVMRAWEAGITVVAAAGNQGPDAMTIGVPGNTPYVITVGAVSDNYTPNKMDDDFVTSFSSAGPTFEGFVKPDMVAPGGHVQGLMGLDSFIGKHYPIYHDEKSYFVLSGSSQSTAITSGIVALMLQNDPSLTPDDIKCRLMYTAKVAVKEDGNLAHSVFQQGAGLVDAISAIDESAVGCGNAGMDIAADLSGENHYVGPARRYENDGDFYIPGTEGMDWNGVYQDSQLWGNVRFMSNSQLWGNVRFNSDSQLWGNVDSDSQLWGNVRFNSNSQLWGNVRFESDSQLWGNVHFFSDSQLWGNVRFDSSSQLWGNVRFNSDSQLWGNISADDSAFEIKWVDQE